MLIITSCYTNRRFAVFLDTLYICTDGDFFHMHIADSLSLCGIYFWLVREPSPTSLFTLPIFFVKLRLLDYPNVTSCFWNQFLWQVATVLLHLFAPLKELLKTYYKISVSWNNHLNELVGLPMWHMCIDKVKFITINVMQSDNVV